MLRSSHVVSGPATGDCQGCANGARVWAASLTCGVRERRVPRLNLVYQPTSPTQSLADPHSLDSKIFSAPQGDERQVLDTSIYDYMMRLRPNRRASKDQAPGPNSSSDKPAPASTSNDNPNPC